MALDEFVHDLGDKPGHDRAFGQSGQVMNVLYQLKRLCPLFCTEVLLKQFLNFVQRQGGHVVFLIPIAATMAAMCAREKPFLFT